MTLTVNSSGGQLYTWLKAFEINTIVVVFLCLISAFSPLLARHFVSHFYFPLRQRPMQPKLNQS